MLDQPDVRRKFQFTDLKQNSNKYWQIEFWENTGRCRVVYGRVGDEMVEDTPRTRRYIDRKIAEKLRKGYVEIDLHVPTALKAAPPPTMDPKVTQLVDLIFSEAGERISQYLAVGVEALSVSQIDKGRATLLDAQRYHQQQAKDDLLAAIQSYYNFIPTQLPRKIELDELVRDFDFAEQETRLNQLEAALATYSASGGSLNHYHLLGADIGLLPTSSPTYEQIADYVVRTADGAARILDIFAVNIPHERAAWDACQTGKHNIVSLFHGTRNHNVRHILKKGLIIPRVAANGSRFGRGIYMADKARRSINYTGGSQSHLPHMMFVADVALGTPCQLSGDDASLTQAPKGYDSVWGVQSWSGMDEFIIYNPAQQTIRAIVTLE